MTKREIYDALTAAGVKLPAYNKINLPVLQEEYAIHISGGEPEKADPCKPEKTGRPPMLIFTHAGWCEALRTSYYIGHYQPSTWEEYTALRPYAKGGLR